MTSAIQFPRFIVFLKDDTKSNRILKRTDKLCGKMMTCAQSGASYTEATTFCSTAFGIDNPKILTSSNIEIREGSVLTDQLYFCQDASKGPSPYTFFRPYAVPCPEEGFIMGNVNLVLRDADQFCLSENLERIVADYGSPVRITAPGGKEMMVLVSDADQVAQICSDEQVFQKNKPNENSALGITRGNQSNPGLFLQGTEETAWGVGHRILINAFSMKSMRIYLPVINERMRALTKAYEAIGSTYFDIPDLMTRMTYDSIGMAMMNLQFKCIEDAGTDHIHPFIQQMQISLDASNYLVSHPLQRNWSKKIKAQKAEAVAEMRRMSMDVIKRRRELISKGEKPAYEDMLSLMMNASDPETGSKMSDEDMVGNINVFLVAGHETTSGLLSFLFYLLSLNPSVESKIEAEIASVLAGTDSNDDIEWAQMTKLTYIEQCLLETLRLYPTAPGIQRTAHSDTVLGGFFVPKGTSLQVPTNALHRDPRVWGEDVLEFKPERFERETRQKREERFPHCYKPFGSGMRACVGMQFAMIEAKVVVAKTLQRFKLRTEPGYQLKIHQNLTMKPDKLFMKCFPREISKVEHLSSPTKVDDVAVSVPRIVLKQADVDHSIPAVGSKIYIVFGSNMGSSKEFATELERKAAGRGFDTVLLSLDDALKCSKFTDAAAILCVTSTYNGFPPDNAKYFDEWMMSSVAILAQGTRYAVFGCGNKSWATFQKFPRQVDARLAELGGIQLLPIGEADADGIFEEAFEDWIDPVLNSLAHSLGSNPHSDTGDIDEDKFTIEDGGENPNHSSVSHDLLHEGSFVAKVAADDELQSPLSTRSTRHIDFILPYGASYDPGDHLAVYAHNRAEDVTDLAARLDLSLDKVIVIRSTRKMESLPINIPLTIQTLLTEVLDLFKPPSKSAMTFLASLCPCPPERLQLEELGSDTAKYKQIIGDPKLTLLEVLHKFKSIPAFGVAELLLLLSPMKPRYYSISSSPKGPKGEEVASITVAHLNCTMASGRIHQGVASTYLKELKPGDLVTISLKKANDAFHLPEDPTSPVIFVGAGTGLAPFMGFLQHRKHLLLSGYKLGPAILVFGCRTKDEDFIYKSELEGYLKDGVISHLLVAFSREKGQEKVYVQHMVQRNGYIYREELEAFVNEKTLTQLHLAFSREKKEKVYVQHLLVSNAVETWKLIQDDKASIFVCGAVRMGADVGSALQDIIADQGGMSREKAKSYLDSMAVAGRYVQELWS